MKCRALTLVCAIVVLGCGGGDTAIVGLGNSDNRIVCDEVAEDVAKALLANPTTPQVSDALIGEIYSSIVAKAREGDPQAAFIVLMLAHEQRNEDES